MYQFLDAFLNDASMFIGVIFLTPLVLAAFLIVVFLLVDFCKREF